MQTTTPTIWAYGPSNGRRAQVRRAGCAIRASPRARAGRSERPVLPAGPTALRSRPGRTGFPDTKEVSSSRLRERPSRSSRRTRPAARWRCSSIIGARRLRTTGPSSSTSQTVSHRAPFPSLPCPCRPSGSKTRSSSPTCRASWLPSGTRPRFRWSAPSTISARSQHTPSSTPLATRPSAPIRRASTPAGSASTARRAPNAKRPKRASANAYSTIRASAPIPRAALLVLAPTLASSASSERAYRFHSTSRRQPDSGEPRHRTHAAASAGNLSDDLPRFTNMILCPSARLGSSSVTSPRAAALAGCSSSASIPEFFVFDPKAGASKW